jgi:predicted pyridoxine 5'-phosphate oxidase superfamily flavin-nucleotide-binding protein
MINEGMKKMIEENAMGLATISEDGKPHNIAVGFIQVVEEDILVISDNYLEETIKNLKSNPNVALVVWAENWKEHCIGYEVTGVAEYFTEGEWINFIKKIPINEGEPCKGAIVVKVNHVKVLE